MRVDHSAKDGRAFPEDGQVGARGIAARRKTAGKRLSCGDTEAQGGVRDSPAEIRDQTKRSARARAAHGAGTNAASKGRAEGAERRQARGRASTALGAIAGRKTIISLPRAPEWETHSFTQPFAERLLQAQLLCVLAESSNRCSHSETGKRS